VCRYGWRGPQRCVLSSSSLSPTSKCASATFARQHGAWPSERSAGCRSRERGRLGGVWATVSGDTVGVGREDWGTIADVGATLARGKDWGRGQATSSTELVEVLGRRRHHTRSVRPAGHEEDESTVPWAHQHGLAE
jgi:hypothetical protein